MASAHAMRDPPVSRRPMLFGTPRRPPGGESHGAPPSAGNWKPASTMLHAIGSSPDRQASSTRRWS